MLWALGQPLSALGLLVAFLLALTLRVVVQRSLVKGYGRRPPLPDPKRDIDPFGAIAAAFGGTGWGRGLADDEVHDRRRRALVLAAGPAAVFAAAQLVLAAHSFAYPDSLAITVNYPSDVLHGGAVAGPGEQFVLSTGVGLLCFAILALVPLPPLDGFGLLWLAIRNPSAGAQRARYWLADHNVGVLILLLLVALPLPGVPPLVQILFNLLGTPLMRLWA